jgi:hypothetical protein
MGYPVKRPWNMMAKYNVTFLDILAIEPYAENWELNPTKLLVRKRTMVVAPELKLLGLNEEGIRNMTQD